MGGAAVTPARNPTLAVGMLARRHGFAKADPGAWPYTKPIRRRYHGRRLERLSPSSAALDSSLAARPSEEAVPMELPCPHCGQPLHVPPELYGQTGLCGSCDAELVFPDPRAGAAGAALEEVEDPERTWRRRREKVISATIAVAVHAVILVLLALLIVGETTSGDSLGTDVAIAELPGEVLTETDEGSLDPAALSEVAQADELTPIEVELATDDALDSLALAEVMPGATGPGGDGLDLRPPGASTGGGKLAFMGIEGSGSRFLIIADASDSMAGDKLEYLKAEILKTLGDLRPGSKFYLIFFATTAVPMPGNRWVSGRSQAVKAASWVRSIRTMGGTEPLSAFELAFRMDPRPDTIFFMTDGLFANNVPNAVARLNSGRKKVTIHAISFIERGAEPLLRQIAEQSGGQYRHVDP